MAISGAWLTLAALPLVIAISVFDRISPELFRHKPLPLAVLSCRRDPLLQLQAEIAGAPFVGDWSSAEDLREALVSAQFALIACDVGNLFFLKSFEFFAIPVLIGEVVNDGFSVYSRNAVLTVKNKSITLVLEAIENASWDALTANFLLTQEILFLKYRAVRDTAKAATKKRTAFLAILSKRENTELRDAIRKTWLSKHGQSVTFKFFVCGEGERNEAETDVVRLQCHEEYPVGRKGILAAKYVAANYPDHPIYLKADDDICIDFDVFLPRIFEHLSENPFLYWGFFERGENHNISLYARGPLIAFAHPVFHALATAAEMPGQALREDVYYAQVLMSREALPLDVVDVDADRFAMTPRCGSEWGEGDNFRTFSWHKVDAQAIFCMDANRMCPCCCLLGAESASWTSD